MRKRGWTNEQLAIAVRGSFSVRQVLARIGLIEAGGNYDQVRRYIKEQNLNTSHFRNRAWNKGLRGLGKSLIPTHEILVCGSHYQSFKLKRRLFNEGLKKKVCEECGWARYTSDGYLPLELDHINGDRHDNRIENLRVLCPNCHSLKPTHRGRNKGKRRGGETG